METTMEDSTITLDKLLQKSTNWKCDLLYNVAKKNTTPEEIVNLSTDYFAKQQSYKFPAHFCGPDEEQYLDQSLKKASLKCGFTLVRRTKKGAKQLEKSKWGADIMMACQSYEPFRRNKQTPPRTRQTSTIRPPSKECACNFVFHLRMAKLDHPKYPGRWYAFPGQHNDGFHRGHWKFETNVLTSPLKLMTDKERELASQCLEASIPPSASKELINMRNTDGMNFTDDQIRYLTREQQEQALSKISSAQELICTLDKMDDMIYVLMKYSPKEALTLSMTNKEREANETARKTKTVSPEEKAKLVKLYNSSATVGGDLLLIVLFGTADEIRRFRMNPHFLCADTTFGTNKEKKELFTLASLDGNNKGFQCGRALIPNSQSWVFNFLFKHCLPIYFGEEICQSIRLLITDGCTREYGGFLNNIDAYPNACHGLCNWHLLIHGKINYVGKKLSDYPLQRAIFDAFVRQWGYEVESAEEYRISKAKFYSWIDELRTSGSVFHYGELLF